MVKRSVIGSAAAVVVLLIGMAVPATAGPRSGNVLRYRPAAKVLKVLGADGSRAAYDLTKATRIRLIRTDGSGSRGNVNDLVFGADVLSVLAEDDNATVIKVDALEGGESDCSFDFSSDDGGGGDEAWDCSFDFEAGEHSESQDVSFDASYDGDADGSSSDVSWDASSDSSIGDGLEESWDCSFDASADQSGDVTEGDLSADASFECSWSGAGFDAAFDPEAVAWTVTARETGETFGCSFDPATVSWDCAADFSTDYVPEPVDVGGSVSCTGDGAAGYACTFLNDTAAGECEVDASFDATDEPDGGDLSGDVSLSCSWGPAEDL